MPVDGRAGPLGLALLSLLWLLAPSAHAEDAEREKPLTEAEAAVAASAAWAAGDAKRLAKLALAPTPDPWLVAEMLLHRGDDNAAHAFASATPAPVRGALVPYVEGGHDHSIGLEPLLAARAAHGALDVEGMEKHLAEVPPGEGSPVVRLFRAHLVADLLDRRQ